MEYKKPIVIFYHTYLVGNFKLLIHEQLMKVFTSGLYDAADVIYIGITAHDDANIDWLLNLISGYSKIKPLVYEENYAEKSTLRYLAHEMSNTDAYVLYFMTKNVLTNTKVDYNQILKNEMWRISMEYHVIDRWRDCVQHLEDGFDSVGINYVPYSHVGNHQHFSGNFWWSKSSHINTLDHNYLYDENLLGAQNPLLAEFWIGSNPNWKYKNMFFCGEIAPYRKETTFREYIK
jgi:hypothetical protein